MERAVDLCKAEAVAERLDVHMTMSHGLAREWPEYERINHGDEHTRPTPISTSERWRRRFDKKKLNLCEIGILNKADYSRGRTVKPVCAT